MPDYEIPSALSIAPAMPSVIRFIVSSDSASTITRASPSVPEYRTTTLPLPCSSCSAASMAPATSGKSANGVYFRTRTFLIVCG